MGVEGEWTVERWCWKAPGFSPRQEVEVRVNAFDGFSDIPEDERDLIRVEVSGKQVLELYAEEAETLARGLVEAAAKMRAALAEDAERQKRAAKPLDS